MNPQQQIKEKSTRPEQEATVTTTFTKKYKVTLILIAIGALIAFNAPMASLFINQSSQLQNLPVELKKHKKDRFFIVKSLTALTQKFNKGEISKDTFTQESEEIISQFNAKHSEIVATSKELKKVKSESEIFRFKSLKVFASQLGLVLSLLVCSFIILTLAIVYVNDKLVRIISYFTGGLIMIPAIFYALWIFTTEPDLSKGKYIFTFVVISIGVSIAMFFVYKLLLQIFMERISLKQRVATLLNLVSSIRYDHFFKLAKKSIHRKLTVEEVTKEADILDEKIYSNYEKII